MNKMSNKEKGLDPETKREALINEREELHKETVRETHSIAVETLSKTKTLLFISGMLVALVLSASAGGLYVYKIGPGFLGMVPKAYGSVSYSKLLDENLALATSHASLESALARAIEGMDRHADGELKWQAKALAAMAECDAHCDAPAMKQFAFALAHDSSKALAAGCIVIPFDTWNEAFRGGFIETIVAAGNTRCVDWVKANADEDKLSEREAELLREYKGGENRRSVNYRELTQMFEEVTERLSEQVDLIRMNEVLMETLIKASPSFGPAY